MAASTDPKQEAAHLAGLVEDIPVIAFDAAAAIAYGPIRLTTRESKKDHLDKLIAAHAVSLGGHCCNQQHERLCKIPWLAA